MSASAAREKHVTFSFFCKFVTLLPGFAHPGLRIPRFGPARPGNHPIWPSPAQTAYCLWPGAAPARAQTAYGQGLAHFFLTFPFFLTFGPAQAACGLWAAPAQARARPGPPMASALPIFKLCLFYLTLAADIKRMKSNGTFSYSPV